MNCIVMVFSWWMALMVGVVVVILILVTCFYLRNTFDLCGPGLKKADSIRRMLADQSTTRT